MYGSIIIGLRADLFQCCLGSPRDLSLLSHRVGLLWTSGDWWASVNRVGVGCREGLLDAVLFGSRAEDCRALLSLAGLWFTETSPHSTPGFDS